MHAITNLKHICTAAALTLAACALFANTSTTIDFDGLAAGTSIHSQYPCVTFSTVLPTGGPGPDPVIYSPPSTAPSNLCSPPNGLSFYAPPAGKICGQTLVIRFANLQRDIRFCMGLRSGTQSSVPIVVKAYDASNAVVYNHTFLGDEIMDNTNLSVHIGKHTGLFKYSRVEITPNSQYCSYLIIDDLEYETDPNKPICAITSPAPLGCICGGSSTTVVGSAYLTSQCNAFDYYTLEWATVTGMTPMESDWTLITSSTTAVNNGPLGVWNTGVLPQGYYWLRVVAHSVDGNDSTCVTIAFLDTQFDTVNITSIVPFGVYGGTVCVGGTVSDMCPNYVKIEYAPVNTSSFQVIDPAHLTYPGNYINQTIGTWNTSSVADGTYQIRTTSIDMCGHTKVDLRKIVVDNTPPIANITNPTPCQYVGGMVPVIGTVSDANLSGWVLEYTGGNSPGWTTIATGSGSIINGLITNWNTNALPKCAYTLRVRASDSSILNCNSAISHTTEYMVSVIVGVKGDVNGDGCLDDTDLLYIINHFLMGCP